MSQYLRPTAVIDYDHAAVAEFVKDSAGDLADPRPQAIRFYYAVRDGIRYDPYAIELSDEGLRASTTLANGRGWCVAKAVLLAACCRAAGIPARLGFADVRNHLSTVRMREWMKTDLFFWHAYTSLCLGGVWVKATPAFNIELCERLGLTPLDFDGRTDALFQPCDSEGNRFMEYLRYRGEFAEVPISQIADTFRREYSALPSSKEADFARDVDRESSPD